VIPWLLKAALAVGLFVGLAVELGRPAAARLELRDIAKDAANVAEEDLADRGRRASQEEARQVAKSSGAQLTGFEVERGGRVRVRVARDVEPVVLDQLEPMRDWYEVEIAATSNGIPGA
jgi:hypothetical protein